MATETLEVEDTKLPSRMTTAAKSEDANAGNKDGTFGNQEVEEDDAAEEKKEEIDKDEEKNDDIKDEEEEDEAEEKDKEKGKGKKSKKDPVMSALSVRPTRERKTVDRFSVP